MNFDNIIKKFYSEKMEATLNKKNPNLIGAILREYAFETDEYGSDFGGYDTFNVNNDFKKVDKDSELGKKIITAILKADNNWSDLEGYPGLSNNLYSDGDIHMGWHSDGDGALFFAVDALNKAFH